MKLKLSQIVNAYAALARVGQERMPIKLAYTLQRNMRLLQPEAEQFEKTRVDLIKTKHGVKDEAENYKVPEKRIPAFQQEMNELLSVEVDVDVHVINLEDAGEVQITALDLMALDWMFTNGETPAVNGQKPRRQRR